MLMVVARASYTALNYVMYFVMYFRSFYNVMFVNCRPGKAALSGT